MKMGMDESEILNFIQAVNNVEFEGFNHEEDDAGDVDQAEARLKLEIAQLKLRVDEEKAAVDELDAEIAASSAAVVEAEEKKSFLDHCDYRRRRALIPLHENDYKRMESVEKRVLALQALTGVIFEYASLKSGVLRGYFKNNAGRLEYFTMNVRTQQEKQDAEDMLWNLNK